MKKKKVLIVDDESYIVNLIKLSLEEKYDVFEAMSGPEALEKIDDHSPHLVLLDIMMPKMSGYEVLEELKKKAHTKDLPVIFLTAKGGWDDKMKALSLGGSHDYITKPFDPDDLLKRVDSTLG